VEDRGVINRFGFNSEGAEKVKGHLSEYREEFGGRGSGRDAGILAETKESTKQEDLVVTEKEGETDHNNRSASGTLGSELTFKLKSEPPNKMLEKVTNSCLWALGWAWNKVMTSTPRTGVLGVNLGKNKTSEDEVGVSCWYSIFLVVYSFKKPATNVSLHPISRTTQLESVNSVPTQTTL
jgi:dihydroorotate dehydrogenase